jgi:hypothetical protein
MNWKAFAWRRRAGRDHGAVDGGEETPRVFLAESAKGLITQYEVLKGTPAMRSMWRRH